MSLDLSDQNVAPGIWQLLLDSKDELHLAPEFLAA